MASTDSTGEVITGDRLERAREAALNILRNDLNMATQAIEQGGSAFMEPADWSQRLRDSLDLFDAIGWPEAVPGRIPHLMEALEKSLAAVKQS